MGVPGSNYDGVVLVSMIPNCNAKQLLGYVERALHSQAVTCRDRCHVLVIVIVIATNLHLGGVQ